MANKSINCIITNNLYRPIFHESWNLQSLYSLATWINGLAFKHEDFSIKGLPVIKIAEIKEGVTKQTKYTEKEYDSIYLIKEGDMLFSWSGQPESSIDVFWWRGKEGWLNQHIFKVIPNENKVCKIYFYYLLKYLRSNFIAIAKNKQTTGLGHVTKKDLELLKVCIPPKNVQKAIARILGALDDKIENNRRMNETLEAIARSIFKSWFIDFDPVRAKAEGRDPGLPTHIANLFPCEFVKTRSGITPKGWNVYKLNEIIDLAYGRALKETERISGDIPVYGSNGLIGWHNEKYVTGPGIIVGRKGNPGVVTWAPEDFFPIDTTFYVVKKKKWISYYFLYYALQHQNLPKFAADSAVPGLNRNLVLMNEQLIPPKDVIELFDNIAMPIFQQRALHEKQNRCLSDIRDALLPKLISGEIKIKDAEKFLERIT